jgi:membrane peptidoglycan carboxypeptidase
MSKRGRVVVCAAMALSIAAGAAVVREVSLLPSAAEMRAQLFARYAPTPGTHWDPLWSISPRLTAAVVAWEDPAFFHHRGISWPATLQAAQMDLAAGAYLRGGSTITQQLAKNLYLSPEKTLRRKFREAVLARRLEILLTKDQILEIYLNTADWGEGIVGAGAAARAYFGKSAGDLDWPEAALLASMLANPRSYHPCHSAPAALRRRRVVLEKLLRAQKFSAAEFEAAADAPLAVACSAVPE